MGQKLKEMPVLALRGMTIFPNMRMHFDVDQELSVKALEAAMENSCRLVKICTRSVPFPISGRFCAYRRRTSV